MKANMSLLKDLKAEVASIKESMQQPSYPPRQPPDCTPHQLAPVHHLLSSIQPKVCQPTLSPHLHHAVEGDVMLASRKMLKTALTASDVAVMNTLQSGAGWVGQVNPEGVL